jgi:hypothetical protein
MKPKTGSNDYLKLETRSRSVLYSFRDTALLEDSASVAELLMAACQNGHHEVVQFLVEQGADIHADNDSDH